MVEITTTFWIIIDLIAGAALGWFEEKIQKAMLWASAVAFILGIMTFAFGNPNGLTQLTIAETTEKITAIVTLTVYFMVNLLFAEIGAIPTNLIRQFFNR